MRLIATRTRQLNDYSCSPPPPYAILSHTWGSEEVNLAEFGTPAARKKQGWAKITGCCDVVDRYASPPISHVWIDTCCIDKSSSAELSESINSMFRYYREAICCFALLSDVEHCEDKETLGRRIQASRWFTRGWTLQELLAPKHVQFFDKNWRVLGTRLELADVVSKATKIPFDMVVAGDFRRASVAQKMSWASGRNTTRPEDAAYCLLGLFDIHMPLLYGEGKKAFVRLQEEILKDSEDQSIFAWDATMFQSAPGEVGLLAPSPLFFAGSALYSALPSSQGGACSISNKGLEMEIYYHQFMQPKARKMLYAMVLSCCIRNDVSYRLYIELIPDPTTGRFSRKPCDVFHCHFGMAGKVQKITLLKQNTLPPPQISAIRGSIRCREHDIPAGLKWLDCYPENLLTVSEETNSLSFDVAINSPLLFDGRAHGIAIFEFPSKCAGKYWAIEFQTQSKEDYPNGGPMLDFSLKNSSCGVRVHDVTKLYVDYKGGASSAETIQCEFLQWIDDTLKMRMQDPHEKVAVELPVASKTLTVLATSGYMFEAPMFIIYFSGGYD